MKTLFALAILFVSFKSMAHTCHISLYDPYNRPYLNFYSQNDNNCQSAAQSCYQTISNYRLNPYQYKCYTISITEDQVVQPQSQSRNEQRTTPEPNRISENDRDYRRQIEMGESVFYKGQYGVATFLTPEGLYHFLPDGKKKRDTEENIDRKDLAVTRGCLRDICTKTSYISKASQSYVSIEGIDFEGRYIVQDVRSKKYSFDVEFYTLAKTKGCTESYQGEVCVGNTILSQDRRSYNRYFEVAGIQTDRMVVLKDKEGTLYFNVDPNSVRVTR